MIHIVFVCLGNICRSPMAAAVMQQLVRQAGLEQQIAIDSVGLGAWHTGEPPHLGTQAMLRQHGIPYAGRARQITSRDIEAAEYLIAMDAENIAELRLLLPSRQVRTKLHRLLEFAPEVETLDVPDSYYVGNFDEVYRLVTAGCTGLLAHLRAEHNL